MSEVYHELVYQELVSSALIGTERAALPKFADKATAAPDPLERALGRLEARLEGQDRENVLLGAVALVGEYQRAGKRLPSLEVAVSPAPPERLPVISVLSQMHLEACLSGQYRTLLAQWLERCVVAGKRVPETQIPALLDAGRNETGLRTEVLAAVGERGRWLATLNPLWKYALPDDAPAQLNPAEHLDDGALWLEGSIKTRAEVLARVRQYDVDTARNWLVQSWKGESGEAREALVPLLGINLSLEDEPLLETALQDRRGGVRSSAVESLSRLSGSGFSSRMKARLEPLLNWDGKKLEVALPGEFDKAMQKDGLEKKPGYGVGERSWWLRQMLGWVPLTYWNETFTAKPLEILIGLSRHDLEDDVLMGFKDALLRFGGPLEWATALLQNYGRSKKNYPILPVAEYLQFVPEGEREAFLLDKLEKWTHKVESDSSPLHLFTHLVGPWSDPFSSVFLRAMREYLGRVGQQDKYRSEDWQMRYKFDTAVQRMEPEVALEALKDWPHDEALPGLWSGVIAAGRSLLEFRRDMARELGARDLDP